MPRSGVAVHGVTPAHSNPLLVVDAGDNAHVMPQRYDWSLCSVLLRKQGVCRQGTYCMSAVRAAYGSILAVASSRG